MTRVPEIELSSVLRSPRRAILVSPLGLAKRDQLPLGLQRQLVVRGTLAPGLQKRLQPVPQDLEVRLAPPPPECAHVLVGGNIVLLNRRTNLVVDIVAF